MSVAKLVPKQNNSKTLVISFAGQGMGIGAMPQFEFLNFLNKQFPNTEKHFYLDKESKWYHKGIDGISTSISETEVYLRNEINGFDHVIFIGSSAGGYAAILFGSLLNVETVLAFRPQTIIPAWVSQNKDTEKYINLNAHINKTTKYVIYGEMKAGKDQDPYHHISHCENIEEHDNVNIIRMHSVDLRSMRDKGELRGIFSKFIPN